LFHKIRRSFASLPPGTAITSAPPPTRAQADEILMVACHNFDLDSARREGYRTAFVRRPAEWGPAGPPDPTPNPACDLIVDGFGELASALVR